MLPLSDAIPAHVDVRWLLPGVFLEIVSRAVRSRGWCNILRASFPQAPELRRRDVLAASFAGDGLSSLLPARGGDLVKLAFVYRRIDGARYSTLLATLIPETSFEALWGAVLVGWMVVQGALPIPNLPGVLPPAASTCFRHAILAAPVMVAAAVISFAVGRRLRRRWVGLASGLRPGLAIFSSPVRFVGQVASWQALARAIRVGSLACFLAAFALPATLGTALLVMTAQGIGRILPAGPVNAGLRIAVLSYGLVEITRRPFDAAVITAFSLGQSATIVAVTLAVSAALIAREFGTSSPRRAMQRARMRLHGARVAVGVGPGRLEDQPDAADQR